jgi:hypothetical protein
MRGGEPITRLGKAGFDGERRLIAPDRFVVPLEFLERGGEPVTRLGESGIEDQRLLVASDRLIVAS